MTARRFREESDTDEEFFRHQLKRHGRDPPLSSLWELFQESPLLLCRLQGMIFLRTVNETIIHSRPP